MLLPPEHRDGSGPLWPVLPAPSLPADCLVLSRVTGRVRGHEQSSWASDTFRVLLGSQAAPQPRAMPHSHCLLLIPPPWNEHRVPKRICHRHQSKQPGMYHVPSGTSLQKSCVWAPAPPSDWPGKCTPTVVWVLLIPEVSVSGGNTSYITFSGSTLESELMY